MKPSTSSYQITVAAVLAAGVLGASELPTMANSRLTPVQYSSSNPQAILVAGGLGFKLNRIRPSLYRVGGFNRNSCPNVDITVVAPPIRPEERSPGNDVAVDSTTSAHPMLFVNIPAELSGKTAEFTVQNEASDQEIYKTTFNLTGKSGIVGMRIPDTAPPLVVGQKYLWQVAVYCSNPEESLNASSWIERVPLDRTLATRIDRATAREKPALYAEAGIWQDTVSTLAELLYRNPNDQSLTQDWASLMQSANLNNVANQPIVQIAGQ
ncbi:MAG TPA: DUF928 domain-containing protein [Chroococcales cyanobacterium]|jgi:hypothetical protein